MQQRPLQIAILAGTTALVMFLSLLATTPLLYRHLAFAPSEQVAASTADEPLDLQTISTFRLLATSARILAPATAPVVTVSGFEGGDIFQRDFGTGGARLELRLRFLQWLMMLGMGAGLILLMIRRFHMTHYAAPLTALIETVNDFSDDPSVANPIPEAVTRSPEFTAAALALDALQRNTLLALRQRERLADIGEAVAKINHDMRNVLSSATLVADTLIASEDPRVRRAAPHVVRSLEQSVVLCQSMMDYLAETPLPDPEIVTMPELADEIATGSGVDVSYSGPERLFLDRTMMARILLNLARNAATAGAGSVSIDIWRADRLGVIDVADDGPGIPQAHWTDLFLAFRSRSRGGTGLGLAIARDLAVAQGGNLKLTRSTEEGSEFRLQLPVEIFAAEDLPSATAPDDRG